MAIVPVMDLKNGKVVRGNQGKRESYSPVSSSITDSADPLDVLDAFRSRYSFQELYVADVDALEDGGDNSDWVIELAESFDGDVMLDRGFSRFEDLDEEVFSAVDTFIAATESLETLEDLKKLRAHSRDTEVAVSVDLNQDGFVSDLSFSDASAFLDRINGMGVEEVVLLDVSQVGTGRGPSSRVLDIARENRKRFSLVSGGGVRDRTDYEKFLEAGIGKVLVSTALHEETLEDV